MSKKHFQGKLHTHIIFSKVFTLVCFVVLFISFPKVSFSQNYCSDNKIQNGTFDGNANGWKDENNNTPEGVSTSRWYRAFKSLRVSARGSHYVKTSNLNLCPNTKKKVVFYFWRSPIKAKGSFTVNVGGVNIFTLNLKDGTYSVAAGATVSESGDNYSIEVSGTTFSNNELKFIYNKTQNKPASYIVLDNVKVYELKPEKPIPTSTILEYCAGETADLTEVEPTPIPNGITYEWHTVNSNPAATNRVDNPSAVTAGIYYLYAKNCDDCYSDPSNAVAVTEKAPVTPIFTQIAPICEGDSFTLPTTSTNSITGTWSPAVNNTQTTEYTFTPNSGQCATTVTMTVTVNPLSNNISSSNGFKGSNTCKGEVGKLTFDGIDDNNYPYVIEYTDGSNTWVQTIDSQATTVFDTPFVLNAVNTYNYTLVSITNADGCKRTTNIANTDATITVRENPALVVGMTVNDYDVCVGDSNPIITFSNSDTKKIVVTYNNGGADQTIEVNGNSTAMLTIPTTSAGLFTYNATSVEYSSTPNCEEIIDKKICVTVFPKNDTAPTVNAGVGTPIVVTAPTSVADFDIEYSFDDGVTWGANTPPTVDNCDGYKIKTRHKLTGTCVSATTTMDCATSPATTRILDRTKPIFTKPENLAVCVNNITEANYANTTNGDVNTPPDYYEFPTGYTDLDITNISDNCCTTNAITWSITPASNGTTISGTGQPSITLAGKKLWLDVASSNPKASYTAKLYTITYKLTDCNGNYTEKTTIITIKPRPKITTVN